ncbi:hypothetical protein [Marinomonas pontica]|nr:hypothetical protein [Marinomonas pontica]
MTELLEEQVVPRDFYARSAEEQEDFWRKRGAITVRKLILV